jgi:type VI secretion system secreted protein Hcp
VAVEEIFLSLEGINGGIGSGKYRDQIQVDSVAWGLSRAGSPAGAAPQLVVDDIVVTKSIDRSSPLIAQRCAVGRSIPTATFTFIKGVSSEKSKVYLKYKLTDSLITSYEINDHGGGNTIPTERISLNFAKIEYEYTPGSGSTINVVIAPEPLG